MTTEVPLYEGGVGPVGGEQSEFLGALYADISLGGCSELLNAFVSDTGIPEALAVLIDSSSGLIVSASQAGIDRIFCPSAVCDAQSGHFFFTGQVPPPLSDSSWPEWQQLIALSQYDTSLYDSTAETLPQLPVASTTGVLLRGILYDVYVAPFPMYNNWWSQLLLVPSVYSAYAARWSSARSAITLRRPTSRGA